MVGAWADSYLGQLRTLAGDERTLMFIGARCVVRNLGGDVLLIRRSDTGEWSLPAGAMELGETIGECAVRELREETGLVALGITAFGIYTRPEYSGLNPFGHHYQVVSLACRVDRYEGELTRATDETTDAAYFPPAALPDGVRPGVPRTLNDLATYEASGRFALD
jgi:ADP-ribose pyrophosphatase YjhB (NUDIX family)